MLNISKNPTKRNINVAKNPTKRRVRAKTVILDSLRHICIIAVILLC